MVFYMSKIVDAKGKNCPIPVIMAKKEIDAGESSFVVEVDNDTAVQNLVRLAGSSGYISSVEDKEGIFSVAFAKDENADPVLSKKADGTYCVFVGKDIIGAGSEELGLNLMRMFFYALSQSDNLPESILFMNAGVKLPAGDEQSIEHLNVLASKGVEILVCGTCLNYYKIADDLKVGTVSNMYDILSKMQSSGKVISL